MLHPTAPPPTALECYLHPFARPPAFRRTTSRATATSCGALRGR